jgi:hypothetical protein
MEGTVREVGQDERGKYRSRRDEDQQESSSTPSP